MAVTKLPNFAPANFYKIGIATKCTHFQLDAQYFNLPNCLWMRKWKSLTRTLISFSLVSLHALPLQYFVVVGATIASWSFIHCTGTCDVCLLFKIFSQSHRTQSHGRQRHWAAIRFNNLTIILILWQYTVNRTFNDTIQYQILLCNGPAALC